MGKEGESAGERESDRQRGEGEGEKGRERARKMGKESERGWYHVIVGSIFFREGV
jgi:hypothetical protein